MQKRNHYTLFFHKWQYSHMNIFIDIFWITPFVNVYYWSWYKGNIDYTIQHLLKLLLIVALTDIKNIMRLYKCYNEKDFWGFKTTLFAFSYTSANFSSFFLHNFNAFVLINIFFKGWLVKRMCVDLGTLFWDCFINENQHCLPGCLLTNLVA